MEVPRLSRSVEASARLSIMLELSYAVQVKNRESAARSRQRKQQYTTDLEQQVRGPASCSASAPHVRAICSLT